MTSQTRDDGFHEIQLNGKQLVFFFMAATVVSVVIFLCGVLVGRGVRLERAAAGAEAGLSTESAAGEPAPEPAAPAAVTAPASTDPTVAAPPSAVDDLSYFTRLDKSREPPDETDLKAVEKPVPAAVAPQAPAAPVAADTARAATSADPQGRGYAVQIAALNVRSEADAIAKRLASRGYAAYVLSPASGAPQVFRVRIGKFPTRREAETMAARLQKEEQFKPWITR